MSLTGRERVPGAKPQTAIVKWRYRVFMGLGVLLLALVARGKIEENFDRNNPIYVPIIADTYIWPEGCEDRKYVDGGDISPNCKSNEYYMGTGLKYIYRYNKKEWSFDSGQKYSNSYYRIGNDASIIICQGILNNSFKVYGIKKNVFKVINK